MPKTQELINLVNQLGKSQAKVTALKKLENKYVQKRKAVQDKYCSLLNSLRASNCCHSCP